MASTHSKKIDLMYVEGTGDIVEALTRWYKQEDVLTETSKTFSGQVFDFCKKNKLNTLAISAFHQAKRVEVEGFTAYSQPKLTLRGGIGYHLAQMLYGLKIVATAIRHRPRYLHITNGATHWFMLAPLKLLGIQLFPQFHNTFWAKGYPPTGKIQRLLLKLDAWFLTHVATGAICCSPEIQHQITEITQGNSCPTYLFKAQFYRKSFINSPAPKAHEVKPFTIIFAGRVERNKGVFDILEMAKILRLDDVRFHICGDGEALIDLKKQCSEEKLDAIVSIHGRLNRPALIERYALGHTVIVPTRSDFAEGFAMVAAEAILLNRPIITSSIVPALETLKTAAIEAEPENIDSYVGAIRQLMTDKALFEQKQHACISLCEQFLDEKEGLTKTLENTLTR